ncbi:hypothetical protein LCGC14_3123340, partial [marine sediment metagenome]
VAEYEATWSEEEKKEPTGIVCNGCFKKIIEAKEAKDEQDNST